MHCKLAALQDRYQRRLRYTGVAVLLSVALALLCGCGHASGDAPYLAVPAVATGPMGATRPVANIATPATPVSVAAGKLDDRCARDADCVVKDAGSCCGYRPQCLNHDSPTDAAAVKARCASEGRVGICGFPAIAGCQCVQGRCAAVLQTDEATVQ